MKFKLTLLAAALCASPAFASAATTWDAALGAWVTGIDAATYGSTGTITFDDHGYIGPDGVGANDFQVGSGFDASRIGQKQNVVTKNPDWLTSDPTHDVYGDFGGPYQPGANMDATVNFFAWAYTTVAGSTFNNMTIDKAGNYFVAKSDMQFMFYDTFQYNNGTNVSSYDTVVNFQPYAISDARGWCGSVLTTDPNSLQRMAGQVTFDFAFDAYLWDDVPLSEGGNGSGGPMTQIVPDFVMRSYGSYVVDVTTSGGYTQHFEGSAVENNTNPVTGELDPAFQNQVSFLGAGVVPDGVWVFNKGTANVTVADVQGAKGALDGETRSDGAVWHKNSFGGYAFLLRADGTRELFYVNPTGHSDYVATVPEPETYAMMLVGAGLVGGMAARRRRQMA
jgi:hypothetical protein